MNSIYAPAGINEFSQKKVVIELSAEHSDFFSPVPRELLQRALRVFEIVNGGREHGGYRPMFFSEKGLNYVVGFLNRDSHTVAVRPVLLDELQAETDPLTPDVFAEKYPFFSVATAWGGGLAYVIEEVAKARDLVVIENEWLGFGLAPYEGHKLPE
jgi:hypothetical protein